MSYNDLAFLKDKGVTFWGAKYIMIPEMALDAQPTLTTTPNDGVPAWLTTIIDPSIIEVLFTPNKAATIIGEVKKGTWLDSTVMFPMTEYVGEVSSYGDFSMNGRSGMNMQFENRQSYLYQTMIEYGELEEERAGLAKVAWAAGLMKSAITMLDKFQNLSYFYGIAGLENYGLLNDPNLNASLTPATKAAGGTAWFSGTSPNATANEVYNDVLSLFQQLVSQTNGLVDIDQQSRLVLALSPASMTALGFTNTFGLTVRGMLQNTFPNLRIESAVQYGVVTTSNTQGDSAGNFMQMISENLGGQDTAFACFNEKLRTHRIVLGYSSMSQKLTQGTFGAVLKQPAGISSMLGI
jgi:hypothetical protein